MENKVDITKLSEQIVKLTILTKADEAIEMVKNLLYKYSIDFKKGPVHELSHKNIKWSLRWDYKGWERHIKKGIEVEQSDWNNTIVTKINEISTQIDRTSLRGGASYIKVHPFVRTLFKTIPYYDEETSMIGGRYDVVYSNDVKVNEIYVISKDWNDVKSIPSNELHFEFGSDLNEISFKHVSEHTEEEVSNYNKKLIGYIKIDNLPKIPEHV